jgi:hypothetical protein
MSHTNLQTSQLGNTGITVTRFASGEHFTFGPSSHNNIQRRIKELNHLLDFGVNYLDVQWEPEEEATAELLKTRKDEFTVCWPLHGVTQLGGNFPNKNQTVHHGDIPIHYPPTLVSQPAGMFFLVHMVFLPHYYEDISLRGV